MKTKLYDIQNKELGEVTLNKDIFGIEPRVDIVQRVVRWQLAKRQAGTHKTKSIGEVRGTRSKPFRQKGTGSARQGSRRSPHMRGGSVIFGPVVRSHAHDLPKKIRRLGLKSALSVRAKDKKLRIVKDLAIKSPKTSELKKLIETFSTSSVLYIGGEQVDENFKKASANLKGIDVLPVEGANVYDILRHDNLVLTEEAVKKLEERL